MLTDTIMYDIIMCVLENQIFQLAYLSALDVFALTLIIYVWPNELMNLRKEICLFDVGVWSLRIIGIVFLFVATVIVLRNVCETYLFIH